MHFLLLKKVKTAKKFLHQTSPFSGLNCIQLIVMSISLAEYLNEERPDALLLLAWNLFGKKNASKCVMADVTEKGFLLNISSGKSETVESISYIFPDGPIMDAKKLKLFISKLLMRHSSASWPPGLTPFIVVVFWIISLISVASERDLQKYPYLSLLQPYALMIFRQPIYATYSVLITIVGHTIEAMYVAFLCSKTSIPKSSSISWVGLTLILGYPTTCQVMLFSKIAMKKSRN